MSWLPSAILAISGNRKKLQAGEYMFDRPMTLAEVFEKIANGRVYLHKFTVPEGLTLRQTSHEMGRSKASVLPKAS